MAQTVSIALQTARSLSPFLDVMAKKAAGVTKAKAKLAVITTSQRPSRKKPAAHPTMAKLVPITQLKGWTRCKDGFYWKTWSMKYSESGQKRLRLRGVWMLNASKKTKFSGSITECWESDNE